MKKNILNPADKESLLLRIDKLTPTTQRLWGKMNVNQGLHHMMLGFKIPLGELTEPSKGGKIQQRLFKWMLLSVPAPKGKAETFPSMNTVNLGIDPVNFEKERTQLRSYIEKFVNTPSYVPNNPRGGPFTRENWGRLMYNHTDHHLKEFGV
jgi:hypothetical protein